MCLRTGLNRFLKFHERQNDLMRLRALSAYVSRALGVEEAAEFRVLTLESLIEAFELDVALFLGIDDGGALRLLEHFGFDRFNAGQRDVIEDVMAGRPTVAVMSAQTFHGV